MFCIKISHETLLTTIFAIAFRRRLLRRYTGRALSLTGFWFVIGLSCVLGALLISISANAGTLFGAPQRISVLPDGTELDGGSAQVAISGNGRFVAFVSTARNLLPGVPDGPAVPSCQTPPVMAQVYVYDRELRRFERVSQNANGDIQALPVRQNGDCDLQGRTFRVDMSLDGRYVSFVSRASNLVSGDTNFVTDAYRFDRSQRRIERITLGNDGVQALVNTDYTSVDGAHRRFVINCENLYNRPEPLSGIRCIKNMDSGAVTPIKPYNGIDNAIGSAFFSADGRFLVYATKDEALIPGGVLGQCTIYVDCYRFVRENLSTGERVLISVKADGGFLDADSRSQAEVSPSGNSVAFPIRIVEFYPPPVPELVGLAVWRDTTGFAEDASVVDFGIGSSGIGYQGFSFDGSGTRLLWRQLDDFVAPPNSDGQQIIYRDLNEPQGHRIIRNQNGGLTLWGHCQKPRRPLSFLPNVSFNCPKISLDGKTIVFSSQDANLVAGDSNFGLPHNVDDDRRQDVFIVSVTESVQHEVPSASLLATLVLVVLIALNGVCASRDMRA